MSYTFPTLSRNPALEGREEELADDTTLRVGFGGGALLTRATTTKQPKRFIRVWRYLTEADKTLLSNMEDTVNIGGGTISWTDEDSTSYTVVLGEQIKFTREPKHPLRWKAKLVMVEVIV